jgi:hypothetical protein
MAAVFGGKMYVAGGTPDGSVGLDDLEIFTPSAVAVNQEPGFTAANPPAVNEDAGTQTLSGWAVFGPGAASESGQDVLAYTVSNISNSSLFAAPPSVDTSGNLTYTPAANANGTSTFDVQVQDDGGTDNGGDDISPSQSFTISVLSVNDEPTVTNPIADVTANQDDSDLVIGLSSVFDDVDAGDTLTLSVSGNTNATLVTTSLVGANLTLDFQPFENGSATITVKATDAGGLFVEDSFDVTVLSHAEQTQDVINDLQDLIDADPGCPAADKLQDAVDKLQAVIVEFNKTPPDKQAALGNLEGAVGELEAAVNDGFLTAATGNAMMDTLADLGRSVAVEVLDLAISLGGDAGEIADAQLSLADGDSLRADEKFKDAVGKYKDALSKAESALPSPLQTLGLGTVTATALTPERLNPLVQEAMALWSVSGAPAAQLAAFDSLDVRIMNLPGAYLGFASADTVWIDADAAGYGWSLDASAGAMHVLSVVMHEMGHVLGHGHDHHDAVMRSTLLPGESHVAPSAIEVLTVRLAPMLAAASEPRDSLFSQLVRNNASQLGGNDLLVSSGQGYAAAAGLITQDSNKSQLIDRVHVNTHDLDGADDDELDLLLGDQAELRVDAES